MEHLIQGEIPLVDEDRGPRLNAVTGLRNGWRKGCKVMGRYSHDFPRKEEIPAPFKAPWARSKCHGTLEPDCTPTVCVGEGTPPTPTPGNK